MRSIRVATNEMPVMIYIYSTRSVMKVLWVDKRKLYYCNSWPKGPDRSLLPAKRCRSLGTFSNSANPPLIRLLLTSKVCRCTMLLKVFREPVSRLLARYSLCKTVSWLKAGGREPWMPRLSNVRVRIRFRAQMMCSWRCLLQHHSSGESGSHPSTSPIYIYIL